MLREFLYFIKMSVVWHTILVYIDFCSNVNHASDKSSDMKVENTESLFAQLVDLQNS